MLRLVHAQVSPSTRVDWFLFLVTLLAITCAAVLAAVLVRHSYVGTDDANIALVYAKNLSQGNGFVYNIGGERVEGFTSLLHVLLAAAIFLVAPWPELFVLGLCILLTTLAVFLPLRALERFLERDLSVTPGLRPLHLIFIAWVVSSPSFIMWTTISLMDVALWCFMICAAVAVLLSETAATSGSRLRLACVSMLAALMPLSRPEGFAMAPVVIVAYFIARRLTSGLRASVTETALPLGAWLATVIGLTVFRQAYFGFPLPNTYYAKVSPDVAYNIRNGVEYLVSFIAHQPLLVIVIIAITAALTRNLRLIASLVRGSPDAVAGRHSASHVAESVCSLVIAAGLMTPVYGGGDIFPGFRFYQPLWPVLLIPAALIFRRVVGDLKHAHLARRTSIAWLGATLAVPALVGLADVPWPRQPRSEFVDQFVIAEDGRRVGVALNRLFPSAPPTVGVTGAGGVKYTYRGPVFDLLGLNSVAMGHSPGKRLGLKNHAAFNKKVFWENAPPVVLPILCPTPLDPGSSAAEYRALSDGILQRLFRDARFQRRYLMVGVPDAIGRRFIDGDPFFFIPRALPRPRAGPDAYQEATLIAYATRAVVTRLRHDGWNVLLLDRQPHVTRVSSGMRSVCTPRNRTRGQ